MTRFEPFCGFWMGWNMNAERLEIARRFAACPKWVWLSGMVACDVPLPLTWRRRLLSQGEIFGWKFDAIDGPVPRGPWRNLDGWVPDLDDEMTRLGCLAVVRRAWPQMDSHSIGSYSDGGWCVEIDDTMFTGPTEEAALLAALEAAPK